MYWNLSTSLKFLRKLKEWLRIPARVSILPCDAIPTNSVVQFLSGSGYFELSKKCSLLRALKVRYCAYKSPPLVSILSALNPVQQPHTIFLTFSLLSSSQLCLQCGFFLTKSFRQNFCKHFFFPLCVTHAKRQKLWRWSSVAKFNTNKSSF